jgi:ribosome-binding ATPase YchF (GTP1/OBG family)
MSSLKIGIAGKPNAGKSTLFSAITGTMVAIGNYAFTTTEPKDGIGFMDTPCPHVEIKKQCIPRRGRCENGLRYVPVEMIDVPGLIEGSSEGKGMGNLFMDALRDTNAIINLINPVDENKNLITPQKAIEEAESIESEILKWFSSRFGSDWDKFIRKNAQTHGPLEEIILQKAAFFNLKQRDIREILQAHKFQDDISKWEEEDKFLFSSMVMQRIRPIIRIVNKGDLLDNREDFVKAGFMVISSDYELSIEKAFTSGLIKGIKDITCTEKPNEKQRIALKTIEKAYESGTLTRIFDVVTFIVKEKLKKIVVYPVYDESKWTDKEGNILPDAFLMDHEATSEDLAFEVHTEIGKGFIRAINGRNKMILGRNYILKDSDVIRIISKTP